MRSKGSKQNGGSNEDLNSSSQNKTTDLGFSINAPFFDGDDGNRGSIDFPIPHDALSSISQASRYVPPIDPQDEREQSEQYQAMQLKIIQLTISDVCKRIWKQDQDPKYSLYFTNFHFAKFKNESNIRQIFNIFKFFDSYSTYTQCFKLVSPDNSDYFNSQIWIFLNECHRLNTYQKYFKEMITFCDQCDIFFGNPFKENILTKTFKYIYFQLSELLFSIMQNDAIKADLTRPTEIMNDLLLTFKIHCKIRSIPTLNDLFKAIHVTQLELSQFFKDTALITKEIELSLNFNFYRIQKIISDTKIINIFLYLIQMIRHLITDTVDTIQNNEILDFRNSPKSNDDEVISKFIFNQLQFDIIDKQSPFLRIAKSFINQVTLKTPKTTFIELLSDLYTRINEFDLFGLKPTLFTLHYNIMMIQFASSTFFPILKTEPFDQTESLHTIYIYLKRYLNKLKGLDSTQIHLWQAFELCFSSATTFDDVSSLESRRNDFKSTYESTSGYHRISQYMNLLVRDLQIIDDTLTFLMQLNKIAKNMEFQLPTFDLTSIVYYSPSQPILSRNLQIYRPVINDLFKEINDDSIFQISEDEIIAPDISGIFQAFIDFISFDSIRNLLLKPELFENEDHLVYAINDIFKCLIKKESRIYYHLRTALVKYTRVYYLLRVLCLSYDINFTNSLKLTYLRSHSKLLFKNEYAKIDLLNYSGLTENPFYQSIKDALFDNSEFRKINKEITRLRLFFNKFAEIIFQLDPSLYSSHYKTLIAIFGWFSNPTLESNHKFLSLDYAEDVKKFYELIATILLNTETQLQKVPSDLIPNVLDHLYGLAKLLKNLNNLQYHYIQYERIELSKKYLREFVFGSTKDFESQESLNQFVSIHPVVVNSIDLCRITKVINCSDNCFHKLLKSTETNLLDNYSLFFKTATINYVSLFKELIFNARLAGNQPLSMIIDVIVRGAFSFENISKLFDFLIKHITESPTEILRSKFISVFSYQFNIDLMKTCMKTAFLLISIYPYKYLRQNLQIDLLRNVNMKNFVDSYIIGFLYLLDNMEHKPLKREGIDQHLSNLHSVEEISRSIKIDTKFTNLYSKMNTMQTAFEKLSRFLAESNIEEYLRIMDNERYSLPKDDIRKAFEMALRALLASGTRDYSGTRLLSKNDKSVATTTIDSIYQNELDVLYYENPDQNYIENSRTYAETEKPIKTDSYFSYQYLNVNIFGNALNPERLYQLLQSNSHNVDTIQKSINSMNYLSLLFTLINNSYSFGEFASFDRVSWVRLTPSFAIEPIQFKHNYGTIHNFDFSFDNHKPWILQPCIDSFFNRKCGYYSAQKLICHLNSELIYFDTPKFDETVESQIAFLPNHYAFGYDAFSSSKYRIRSLIENCNANLQQVVPSISLFDSIPDKPLPIGLQQALIDQIEEHSINSKVYDLMESSHLDTEFIQRNQNYYDKLSRATHIKELQKAETVKMIKSQFDDPKIKKEMEKTKELLPTLIELTSDPNPQEIFSSKASELVKTQLRLSQNLEKFKMQQNENSAFDFSNQLLAKIKDKKQPPNQQKPFRHSSFFTPLKSHQNQQPLNSNSKETNENDEDLFEIQKAHVVGLFKGKSNERIEGQNSGLSVEIDESLSNENNSMENIEEKNDGNEQVEHNDYLDQLSELLKQ